VLRARDGDIWTKSFLAKLAEATDEVFFLPGIDRRTVTSLWTPNTRYIEITEDGMRSEDVIGGDITRENLTDEEIVLIRNRVIHGGHVDVDQAAQDIRDRISAIEKDLPSGIGPPKISKFDIGAIAVLSPMNFLMGMPFPLGLRRLKKRSPELVPWALAANGGASVIGSILCVLLAMEIGFTRGAILSAAVYVVAMLAATTGPLGAAPDAAAEPAKNTAP